jgi:hypothetical protein
MEQSKSRQIATALLRADASTESVALSVVQVWAQVDTALGPIVGTAGVVALYNRCIHLVSGRHAWMAGAAAVAPKALDTAPLRAALTAQDAATAAALGGELFETFREVLSSMVGVSLTERLLRPAWAELLGGPAAEDQVP